MVNNSSVLVKSDYEIQRERNLKRNAEVLRNLGLEDAKIEIVKRRRKTRMGERKKKKSSIKPTRRSTRNRRGPKPPLYVPEEVSSSSIRRDLVKSKRKYKGDRFGEVRGVSEGQVFGAGDYQRKGRKEMSENGFFHPFVTPEFIERNGACYSVIFNNDNGLSKDKGDEILYAGSGGRLRGQNRTAKQSFHQTWDNATNASLKRNFEKRIPIRVIRGPKLKSKYGTRLCGGGFRYDGLYDVSKAEMIENGPKRLRTAMFTLKKRKSKWKNATDSEAPTGVNVSWKFGGRTYYGNLIKSRETKTHCYARTHNGNIKTLTKGKAYWKKL